MDLILLPRVKNAKLQSLADSTVNMCKTITELQVPMAKVSSCLTAFKEGMLKDQASGKAKQELDNTRDKLISGLNHDVKAESYFPHTDSEVKKCLQDVRTVLAKYGINVTRLPLDEETAAVDNLVIELKGIDLTPLAETGLPRWVPLIENANNEFKNAAKTYIEDSVVAAGQVSATALAPPLIDSLEALYAMLYAHIKINPAENLVKAHNELEKLVDTFR